MSEQRISNSYQREFLFVFSTDDKKYNVKQSVCASSIHFSSKNASLEDVNAVRQKLIAELRSFGC